MIVTRLRQYYAKIEDQNLSKEEMDNKISIDTNLMQRFKLDKEVMILLNFTLRHSEVLPDKEKSETILAIISLNGLHDEQAAKTIGITLLQGKISVAIEILTELCVVSA